jgi:hypothetical protein
MKHAIIKYPHPTHCPVAAADGCPNIGEGGFEAHLGVGGGDTTGLGIFSRSVADVVFGDVVNYK